MRISDWSSDVCSSDLAPCPSSTTPKFRPEICQATAFETPASPFLPLNSSLLVAAFPLCERYLNGNVLIVTASSVAFGPQCGANLCRKRMKQRWSAEKLSGTSSAASRVGNEGDRKG